MTALLGAPGAALLHLVLALAAWPATAGSRGDSSVQPPSWTGSVWAVLWIGYAVLDLLPGNGASPTVAGDLTTGAATVPQWLGFFDRRLASGVHGLGSAYAVLLVAAELTIGILSLTRGSLRPVAYWSGIGLAALYWAAGQSFGQLFSGQATDPSTGPLVMLLGLAALGALPATARSEGRRPVARLSW
jgi:hypothetical protein